MRLSPPSRPEECGPELPPHTAPKHAEREYCSRTMYSMLMSEANEVYTCSKMTTRRAQPTVHSQDTSLMMSYIILDPVKCKRVLLLS